jgi:N-acetylneuraminic acid mutarotase
MPTPRCCLALVEHPDGTLYAIGGGGEGNIQPVRNSVEQYDPLLDVWITRAAMPTARSFAAAAVAEDGRIYVVGGFTLTNYLATVEVYDPDTDSWAIRRNMQTPRSGLGLVAALNGKLYAAGGFNGDFLSTVEEYDPTADTWTPRQPMTTRREHFGFALGPDGLLYAVGGGNGPLLATAERYDAVLGTWAAVTPMPSPRWAFGFTLGPNDNFYVIGGNSGGNLATVLEYDPSSDSWTIRESMLTARQGVAAATAHVNSRLYAIGGAVGFPELATGANEEATIVGWGELATPHLSSPRGHTPPRKTLTPARPHRP